MRWKRGRRSISDHMVGAAPGQAARPLLRLAGLGFRRDVSAAGTEFQRIPLIEAISALYGSSLAASALVPLHRGYDRLKINHIGADVLSSPPSQPVRITVQRY